MAVLDQATIITGAARGNGRAHPQPLAIAGATRNPRREPSSVMCLQCKDKSWKLISSAFLPEVSLRLHCYPDLAVGVMMPGVSREIQ